MSHNYSGISSHKTIIFFFYIQGFLAFHTVVSKILFGGLKNLEMSDTPDTPRRTIRRRNKPIKYGDFLDMTPTTRNTREENTSDEEDECFEEVITKKPTG